MKFVLLSLALSGACGGSQDSGAASEYSGIESSFAKKEEPQAPAKPAKKSTQPVEGVDIAALDGELATRFNALLDSLASPCGKAHSLRTSRNEDSSCKRAPYAVSYAYELVKDGADDDQIKDLHRLRFRDAPIQSFRYDLSAPHAGDANAPVKVVEFFDYGCPACARFHPLLETVATDMKGDVVIYFKQFPLSSHKDSPGAAQAALAAHKQGKFGAMHLILFENQHEHLMMNLVDYAKQIGLDMSKFRKDYIEAEALVKADRAEGERAGVNGTPAVYINGREYEGPAQPKYFKMWVEEAREGAI
ncbi:MAG: thioredoxin domain-containing protein [Kofleriaceae bacterium]|nr:thioredoxin domain-containing protein [Kofleriaceae bacterium]